ncbi:hypothetical protein CHM34_14010 [Paludifilum halophilum]|uniref:Uncharacterized protein n=1 Tax=Paludifilum halophilum TaxID=1642702 RepID=A0A235B407_9BACL|nr:hypothetical protein CHM34_14010 [Paludifilum halophilum]
MCSSFLLYHVPKKSGKAGTKKKTGVFPAGFDACIWIGERGLKINRILKDFRKASQAKISLKPPYRYNQQKTKDP